MVCAKKENVDLRVYNGKVTVHIGFGLGHPVLKAAWNDDSKILDIIRRINHGKDGKGAAW